MNDFKDLKRQIAQVRSIKGKAHFPDPLKLEILEAAKSYGVNATLKALSLSPSTLYKWQKNSKFALTNPPTTKTTFIEIPRPLREEALSPGKEPTEVRWEAVRPDGSILRCVLSRKNIEIGSIFDTFLKGGRI